MRTSETCERPAHTTPPIDVVADSRIAARLKTCFAVGAARNNRTAAQTWGIRPDRRTVQVPGVKSLYRTRFVTETSRGPCRRSQRRSAIIAWAAVLAEPTALRAGTRAGAVLTAIQSYRTSRLFATGRRGHDGEIDVENVSTLMPSPSKALEHEPFHGVPRGEDRDFTTVTLPIANRDAPRVDLDW